MKREFLMNKKLWVISAILLLFVFGCHFTQQTLPSDAGSTCSSSLTTTEFNSWFESGAVALNGAVKPANSVTFPNVPNCSFYKWSEQMFLWLNSPAPPRYGSNGLVINSPAFFDVSPEDASGQRTLVPHKAGILRAFNVRRAKFGSLGLPVIMEKGSLRLLQVLPPVLSATGRQLVIDKSGREVEIASARVDDNGKPVLIDVSGKQIEAPRALIQSSKDSIISSVQKKMRLLDNFDRTSLVQKIMIGNKAFFLDLFGNFPEPEQGQADGSVLMAQNGSLVYYAITVNNVYALFRSKTGDPIPFGTRFPINQSDLDAISGFATTNGKSPILDSEALAIEVKSSWVEAKDLPDADKFIKMTAVVPTYNTSNPNDWVPNGTKTVELAMVGMHVVGSTNGHPEMLWATFEHVSNDPAAAYSYLNISNTTSMVAQNTAGKWVFCSNNSTGPFNVPHMQMGSNGHIISTTGNTITPSDIRRERPWGLPGNTARGNAEVISINNIVRSLLDNADIRRNYIQTGTTWTIGGASPNSTNQVGTNKLGNTTMETFTQGSNCFSCHSTNTTAVSHIFSAITP